MNPSAHPCVNILSLSVFYWWKETPWPWFLQRKALNWEWLTVSEIYFNIIMTGSMATCMQTWRASWRVQHLDLQTSGNKSPQAWASEISKPMVSDRFPPSRQHFLILSSSTTPWWLSIKHMSLWGPFIFKPSHTFFFQHREYCVPLKSLKTTFKNTWVSLNRKNQKDKT